MGVYTCIKPANFAGVKYMPGDIVPEEAIPADRVGAVIRLGLIAEVQPAQEVQPAPPAPFTVPVRAADGTTYDVEVTPEAVVEIVTVLQLPVEAATDRIKAIMDDNTLIVVDACDSRKTVKKAAAARAAELKDNIVEPPAHAEPPEEPPERAPGDDPGENPPGTREGGGEDG